MVKYKVKKYGNSVHIILPKHMYVEGEEVDVSGSAYEIKHIMDMISEAPIKGEIFKIAVSAAKTVIDEARSRY